MEIVRISRRPTRVMIDLNVRVRGLVRAGFEDSDGPLQVGETVVVYEPEDAIAGTATVVALEPDEGFMYLDVEWSSFADDVESTLGREATALVFYEFGMSHTIATSSSREPSTSARPDPTRVLSATVAISEKRRHTLLPSLVEQRLIETSEGGYLVSWVGAEDIALVSSSLNQGASYGSAERNIPVLTRSA